MYVHIMYAHIAVHTYYVCTAMCTKVCVFYSIYNNSHLHACSMYSMYVRVLTVSRMSCGGVQSVFP